MKIVKKIGIILGLNILIVLFVSVALYGVLSWKSAHIYNPDPFENMDLDDYEIERNYDRNDKLINCKLLYLPENKLLLKSYEISFLEQYKDYVQIYYSEKEDGHLYTQVYKSGKLVFSEKKVFGEEEVKEVYFIAPNLLRYSKTFGEYEHCDFSGKPVHNLSTFLDVEDALIWIWGIGIGLFLCACVTTVGLIIIIAGAISKK